MTALDDVRFWVQVVESLHCTIIVPPELQARAVEMVERRGLAHLVTVRSSRSLPAGVAYLVQDPALAALDPVAGRHAVPRVELHA